MITAIEKEINVFLLQHKQSLQRIMDVVEAGGDVKAAVQREIENVDAMLYQKPPMDRS